MLEFPGSVNGPWARYVHDPDSRGIGTVRYPRLVPKDQSCAKALSTLTNLYNERPTWLALAHQKSSPDPTNPPSSSARRVKQIVVLAERERCHLIEERLLTRMDVRRIEAAEAEAAAVTPWRWAVS